jgi:alanine dehydrogenase
LHAILKRVLIPGAKAPKKITRDMPTTMNPGSVPVEVAIDQGGCFETSNATPQKDPIYVIDGVIHYCMVNRPGKESALIPLSKVRHR